MKTATHTPGPGRKSEHTKGPWVPAVYEVTTTMIERMALGSLHHAVCLNDKPEEGEGMLIALCGDEPESAQHARLIAAAPELLEALKDVAKALWHWRTVQVNDTIAASMTAKYEFLQDAIAKAEGRD